MISVEIGEPPAACPAPRRDDATAAGSREELSIGCYPPERLLEALTHICARMQQPVERGRVTLI